MTDEPESEGSAAPDLETGDPMHIHRPKPLHGWREVLLEIGVIVIGIAVALMGEQTLEWLHRQSEVGEARQALRSEITANARAARYSIEEDRCLMGLVDRQVAWANGGVHAPTSIAGRFPEVVTSTWEVVKVGAAAHMPLGERLAYARLYDAIEAMRWSIESERTTFLRLYGHTAMATLSPTDAKQILEDSAQARILAVARSAYAAGVLRAAKAVGVEPGPLGASARDGLAKTCALGLEHTGAP